MILMLEYHLKYTSGQQREKHHIKAVYSIAETLSAVLRTSMESSLQEGHWNWKDAEDD